MRILVDACVAGAVVQALRRIDLERDGVVTAEAGGRVRVSAGKSVH
ncbi:MAG TPA: hypothetical protein VMF67_07410 [Rhizomicrobium sp.]|nr:hypothetical protein [Rhizomicrobium sp.]